MVKETHAQFSLHSSNFFLKIAFLHEICVQAYVSASDVDPHLLGWERRRGGKSKVFPIAV